MTNDSPSNPWAAICEHIRAGMDEENFRRWFGVTAYASDSGDQISVWVPTEAIRRHIVSHFQDAIDHAVAALGRSDTEIRFIVTGVSEDEDDLDDE